MGLFHLAWRNLWRSQGRSFATLFAVAAVVTLTLAFFGLTGAARNGIYYSATRAGGHLQVHSAGYREARGFRDGLIPEALQQTLQAALPGAEVVAVLAVPALLERSGRSYGIVLQGLSGPAAAEARFRDNYLMSGSLPTSGDVDQIALGEKLAANLQADLGDTVYLYAPGTDGYGAAAYTVAGLLRLPGSESIAVTALAAAQDLAAPGAINRLDVTFPALTRSSDDRALADLAAHTQAATGPDYTVETWTEVSPDLAGFVAYFRRVSFIFAIIFFVLAGFLVANTVYLSVIERVREFGLLHALGAPRSRVVRQVLLESVLLCLCGALLGLAAGLGVVALLARGVSFPPQVADFLAEQGLPRVFYGSVGLRELFFTLGFSLVTANVAALLPALSAGRLEPAEAMRFTA